MTRCRQCGLPLVRRAGGGREAAAEGLGARRGRHDFSDAPPPGAAPNGDVEDAFCCFGCRVAWRWQSERSGEDAPFPRETVRLALGAFLALNTMAFHGLFYGVEIYGESARSAGFSEAAGLFGTLLAFLAACAIALLAPPLLEDLKVRRLPGLGARGAGASTSFLVLLAAGAAYALSAANVWRGEGPVYFDACAGVLLMTTFGKALEARARRRAGRRADPGLPGAGRTWSVERDGESSTLATDELAVGDHVHVPANAEIPVDGTIVSGSASIDARRLTGESNPVPRSTGERVLAGTRALDGALVVRTEAVGESRRLAETIAFLFREDAAPSPAERMAERAASIFLPLVLGLALVTGWTRSLPDAMSVLLIGCPCALVLAPATALWTSRRTAFARGIVFGSLEAIERAASIRRVLLDKTGTLTEGSMRWVGTDLAPVAGPAPTAALDEHEVLRIAAALETDLRHPSARALVEAVPEASRSAADERDAVAGIGVRGVVDGVPYLLGNARALERVTGAPAAWRDAAPSAAELFLTDGTRVVARFRLEERPRPESAAVVDELKALGLRPELLSGDGDEVSKRLGERWHIPAIGELEPLDKVEVLRARRRESGDGSIAFVGDGWNDAPAIREADLGLVVHEAEDWSRAAADVHLTESAWRSLPDAFRLARSARRRLYLSLGWGFFYNSIGLALAVSGKLSPVFAASAMAISSLVTLRLAAGGPDATEQDPALPGARPWQADGPGGETPLESAR